MRQHPHPVTDLSAAIGFLLDEQLHPSWYANAVIPWRRLIADPEWKKAKPLLAVDADHVSMIVETLVATKSGSRGREALMCLGKVRQFRGDHGRAIEAFEQIVERDPDIKALQNIGVSCVVLGRTEDAIAAFRQVLDLRPGDERATSALEAIVS